MANLVAFSNELLVPIASQLRDGRIDPFDPVATKDLQNVRLVSRRVSFPVALAWPHADSNSVKMLAIATPMLFENMVYDLKFYKKQDVDRCAPATVCTSIFS